MGSAFKQTPVILNQYQVWGQFKDILHDFHSCISYARNANCLKYVRLALALRLGLIVSKSLVY